MEWIACLKIASMTDVVHEGVLNTSVGIIHVFIYILLIFIYDVRVYNRLKKSEKLGKTRTQLARSFNRVLHYYYNYTESHFVYVHNKIKKTSFVRINFPLKKNRSSDTNIGRCIVNFLHDIQLMLIH